MATQKEKDLIMKLDKEVALIKKDIHLILNNHLHTIQNDMKK